MNYLAHVHLACHSEAAMVGAFLGDFLRPQEVAHLGPEVGREMLVHRHVDAFTDAHPRVRALRRLCQPKNRLFARVSLDVLFDHVLARSWSRYALEPLGAVADRFYAAIEARRAGLPDALNITIDRMRRYDWLRSYARPESVDAAVARLAQRLSRKGDHLVESLHELRAHAPLVEEAFHAFYPELVASAGRHRAGLRDDPERGPRERLPKG